MDSENDLSMLSSSYSMLTAERILAHFGLQLEENTLFQALKNPKSVYYAILLVPFKNVINGIIYQQAYDYQVYAQKLFINYYLSGQGNDNPEGQGAETRGLLEQNREQLIQYSESFDKTFSSHKQLILETQASLLALVKEMKPIQDTEVIAETVQNKMSPFHERAQEMKQYFNRFRSDFKALIIDTKRLLTLVPGYRENEELNRENKIEIEFDDQIGT